MAGQVYGLILSLLRPKRARKIFYGQSAICHGDPRYEPSNIFEIMHSGVNLCFDVIAYIKYAVVKFNEWGQQYSSNDSVRPTSPKFFFHNSGQKNPCPGTSGPFALQGLQRWQFATPVDHLGGQRRLLVPRRLMPVVHALLQTLMSETPNALEQKDFVMIWKSWSVFD